MTLTGYAHHWATGFAGAIQKEMIGTDDLFYAPTFLNDIMQNMKYNDASLFSNIAAVLSLYVLSAASMLLSLLSFFVVSWAIWGYALAKLIGWMLIPFMLLPITQSLFQKWFGFFVGFLFYEIIGRTNVAMVLMLMASFFNVPLSHRPSRVIEINAEALSDMTGLLAMVFIGILALLSTGKFAAAFAGAIGGSSSGISLKDVATKIAGKLN